MRPGINEVTLPHVVLCPKKTMNFERGMPSIGNQKGHLFPHNALLLWRESPPDEKECFCIEHLLTKIHCFVSILLRLICIFHLDPILRIACPGKRSRTCRDPVLSQP